MFNLDQSLGFLVNGAAFAMRWAIEERLAKHNLTAPQWAVLVRLWEEDGRPPSLIGETLHSDRPTVSGIVDRLEAKGLVRKTRDAEDRRVVRVYLTDKARQLLKLLPPLAKEVNQIAVQGMSEKDIERLKTNLRKIRANFRK